MAEPDPRDLGGARRSAPVQDRPPPPRNAPRPEEGDNVLQQILGMLMGGIGGMGGGPGNVTTGGGSSWGEDGSWMGSADNPLFGIGGEGGGETAATATSVLAPELQAEFTQAVNDGTVPDFFTKHPNLTPEQFSAIGQILNQASAGDAGGWLGSSGRDPRLGLGEQAGGISSDEAQTALATVVAEANKKNIIISGSGGDPRTVAEQYIRNQPMLGDQENPYKDPNTPIPDEILNAVISTLARDNPGFGEGPIPANTAFQAGPKKYVVEAGDSMSTIATEMGIPLADLMRANSNVTDASLAPGMALVIPAAATPTTGATGTPGVPQTGAVSPTQDRAGGEQTQPVNPAENPYAPGTTEPANPFDTDFGDPLLQSIFKQGLLPVELIQSKGYTPGTSAVLEDQLAVLGTLASLQNILNPGSVDYTGEGISKLFEEMKTGGQPLDADSIITEALSSDAYRAAEMADPNEAFGVLAAARAGNIGDEAASLLYTGGYAQQLQLEYEKTFGGTAAEQRPTLLEFLISKGL